MIELAAGDYRLALEPERGGSVARFSWRRHDLFRRSRPGSMFETGCFPLVPFSNRIANGRFCHGRHAVDLAPNMPGSDHPHPMHGFGWLAPWQVLSASPHHAVLEHRHAGGEWPWPYLARQQIMLGPCGLTIGLSVRNLGADAMPAGLGLHPYFPREPDTTYLGLHRGEWQNDADCLPLSLIEHDEVRDWWGDAPATRRNVDTAYTDRSGPLSVAWPAREYGLKIEPCDALSTTVVYTPAGADFLCIEPVSHATNAHNRPLGEGGLVTLPPNEQFSVSCRFRAHALAETGAASR